MPGRRLRPTTWAERMTARSCLWAALIAGWPLTTLAAEPAATPAAMPAETKAVKQAEGLKELEADLDFLEFLGEAADGDQAFDEFLLSREFDGALAKSEATARRQAAKDGER